MSISNEEFLIRGLVDDIYQMEEKINLLNESINKDNGQNFSFKRIENLKSIKSNLIQQKIALNDSLLLETKNNSDIIQEKIDQIKNIENNLESKKAELIDFNIVNFKCSALKKYILSKGSNEFLSEEQINEIIFDDQMYSNNSEIQKLKREIEINKASQCVIINNCNEINSKKAQFEENLKMLKEERNIIKNQLVNFISCKETVDQIIKLNLGNLNIHKKESLQSENFKENNYINNKWKSEIHLFNYELNIINAKKAANILCNDLFSLFNINNNKEKYKIYSGSNINLLEKRRNNISNYSSNEYLYDINSKNKSSYNIINNRLNNKDNYHGNFKNENILDKNHLIKIAKNEIEKYTSGKQYLYKTLSEFLENLSYILIRKFQYIDITISSETLSIYLTYLFKSLYYESIINANIKFINKDYKNKKKEYKKLIQYLISESTKLETKYNEYQSKTKIIEKQIKLLQKENSNNKILGPIYLSLEEQRYLQICSQANGLIKKKNSIEEKMSEYEEKNQKIKNENDSKVKNINKEINKIDKQIKKINEDIIIKNNIANKNIAHYQNIIQEKYNIIKKYLQNYKNRYGSNLDIYNRLIRSINDTIDKTYHKGPLIIINNNNSINNSNIYNNKIGRIIQNYSNNNTNSNCSNKNIKNLILSQNDNEKSIDDYLNIDKNIKNKNSKKELFNYEFNISSIEKSSIDSNKILKNNNDYSINDSSISNQIECKPYINITEENIKKLNSRRKLNKTLNNRSYIINSNSQIKNSLFNYKLKRNNIKINSNSINYDLKDKTGKTFNYSSLSTKNSQKPTNSRIKFSNYKGNSIWINNNSINSHNTKNIFDTNTNYIRVKKFNIFNKNIIRQYTDKYKSNSFSNKSQTSINKCISNTNIQKNKFQSFSFLDKKNLLNTFKNKSYNKSKISNDSLNKEFEDIPIFNSHQKNNSHRIRLNNYKKIIDNLGNKSYILNINKKLKLSLLKTNLKEISIPHQNISQKMITEKIKPLNKMTFYYYRKFNTKMNKYNPLFTIPSEILCKLPYNFESATISLSKKYDTLRITPIEKIDRIEINISEIEATIVNSKIKLIIEVHRNYRKYKKIFNNKSMEDFVNSQIKKYPSLTSQEIEKCAKNKNFNFSLMVCGGKIFEIIIYTYQEFKMWINGLSFLIKNKKQFIHQANESRNSKF